MNPQNRIMRFCWIAVAALLLTGCNDFLDKNPDNRADLNTPQNVAALLGSAYPEKLHVWFAEVMSDNATDVGPTASYTKESLRQAFYWERVTDETQDTPAGFWFGCYNAIAHANHALEAIYEMEKDGYTASELNPIKGEALLCRAYSHFMLVNLFAEHYDPATAASMPAIPYVTEPETKPLVEYVRLSVGEVYKWIENDMTEGYSLIRDNSYTHPKWHFNKKAAATFMSRFYLYRGLEGDWEKVIRYANIAMEDSPRDFLRDWLGIADASFEVFGKEYSKSTNRANFMLHQHVSTVGRLFVYRYAMDLSLLQKRVVNTDPHPTETGIRGKHVFINKATGSAITGCYGIVKYTEEFKRNAINADVGIPYVMFPAFSAEEALFNRMEAEIMQENYPTVIELLNLHYSTRVMDYDPTLHRVTDATVQKVYGSGHSFPSVAPHYALNEKQQAYLDCVINIRATEFIGEGQRWYDIKRMHLAIDHQVYRGPKLHLSANDPRRVIPLPQDAVDLPLKDDYLPLSGDDLQYVNPEMLMKTNE